MARFRLAVLLALALVLATPAAQATSPRRLTAQMAAASVEQVPWVADTVVASAECLATDAVAHPDDVYATRFACRLDLWKRPPSISPARWRQIAAAWRVHDSQRFFSLLGLPRNRTGAQTEARLRELGLDKGETLAAGLRVTPTSVLHARAPIPLPAFTSAADAYRQLLYAMRSLEIYHSKHPRTYAGLTLATLKTVAPIDDGLTVVRANRTSFCVEQRAVVSSTVWSLVGLHGGPRLGGCGGR